MDGGTLLVLGLLSSIPTEAITAFGIEGGLSREQPPPRPEQIWDNPLMRPAFGESPSVQVVTPVGRVAYLHCRVNHLGSRVVTWIRKRDGHALTVGLYSFTTDQRFTALHAEGSPDWVLKITSPQTRDTGVYECQVSTDPTISKYFNLTVIESKAIISGTSNRHMSAGNNLNLTCYTSVPSEVPSYYYWYHNDDVIRYTTNGQGSLQADGLLGAQSPSGPYTEVQDDQYSSQSKSSSYPYREAEDGLQPAASKLDDGSQPQYSNVFLQPKSTSTLIIENVGSQHSGNYTCAPENSVPATVIVYVLRAGEQPAAMQHGESSRAQLLIQSTAVFAATLCSAMLLPVLR